MASFNELSLGYFERLKKADIPYSEFERILKKINNLVYSESQRPISDADKAKIVSLIIEKLDGDREKFFSATESKELFESHDIVKSFSNDNYLDLIRYIRMRTKTK